MEQYDAKSLDERFHLEWLFNRCLRIEYIDTDEDGSFAFIKDTYNKTLYLFLQRSNGKNDWKNNFDFPAVPYKDMPTQWKAHRGFVRVWKSIEPVIKDTVLDLAYKHIIIVGYSHGASLAVLAHEYVWFNRPDIRDEIYGIGFDGARVFCGNMPDQLSERWSNFYMIRNANDIVTRVPPKIFGYKHVGNLIEINKECDLIDRERFPLGLSIKSVQAHYPTNIRHAIGLIQKN